MGVSDPPGIAPGSTVHIVPGQSIAAAITQATAKAARFGNALLRFWPGHHSGATDEVFSIPAGIDVDMRGALLVLKGANSGLRIDAPDSTYFLRVSGGGDSLLPIHIGTGAGGQGANAIFESIFVTGVGAGGTCCRIDNLQNSVIHSYRHRNADGGAFGLVIDNGSKNVDLVSIWASHADVDVLVTTSGGAQQTSKINFLGGLSEAGSALVGGWRIEDAANVRIEKVQFNGGNGAGAAIKLVAGGNRSGGGPHPPVGVTIADVGFNSWGKALEIDTATEVHVASWQGSQLVTAYQVEDVGARIFERRHFLPLWTGARFASGSGAVEATCVIDEVTAASLAGLVPLSTVTTADDLIVGTGAGAVARLGVAASRAIIKKSAGALIAATAAELARTFGLAQLVDEVHANAGAANLATEQVLATLAIPTDVAAGDWLQFVAFGDALNNSAGAVTYLWRFKIGATTVLASSAVSVANTANRKFWDAVIEVSVRATNSQDVDGRVIFEGSAGATGTLQQITAAGNLQGRGTAAEDLTAGKNAVLTCQLGTADALADVILHGARLVAIRKAG